MKKLNPAFLKAMADRVNESPYYVHTSMEIKEIDWGYCLMQVAVQDKHLQPYGMVHGGVYAALVDAAAYWAVFTQLHDNAKMITIDLKLNYLGSASNGLLLAKGKSIKLGKTLGIGEAAITDEDAKLLTHGTATFMVLGDLEINRNFELPPRFLD
jgi:uncharacterized protein (TIGR00369 family)